MGRKETSEEKKSLISLIRESPKLETEFSDLKMNLPFIFRNKVEKNKDKMIEMVPSGVAYVRNYRK